MAAEGLNQRVQSTGNSTPRAGQKMADNCTSPALASPWPLTCAALLKGVEGLDCVAQAAHGVHHGHCRERGIRAGGRLSGAGVAGSYCD